MNFWPWIMIPVGYLAGSFPTAYLLGRVRGLDLRRMGSGSLGGSNAGQFIGFWAFLLVAAVDIAKVVIVTQLALLWSRDLWLAGATGLAALAGHNWSLYLRWIGGRGVGAALGVLLVLFPIGWVVVLLPALIAKFLRRDALGNGLGFVALPIVAFLMRQPDPIVWTCTGLLFLVMVKRLAANGAPIPPERRWNVLRNRLLHDRDVGPDEAWVERAPV
ncbi:MAG: glycerol-3-phosphate acyltransferase [Anaerolineae bacterium]